MRPVTPTDNLHTIYMHEGRLCVECRSCAHRATLTFAETRGQSHRYIAKLNLKCSECGGREIARYLPTDKADAEAFMRGD